MPVDVPLILFAKAPVAGKVKTRLCPPLNHEQAAEVATVLLEESLKLVVKHWRGRVILAVAPSEKHPVFQQAKNVHGVNLIAQKGNCLGQRMANALNEVGYPAAVMGCDVPHCTAEILQQASSSLQAREECIGPTEDGGYYILGLTTERPHLFEEIDWGSSQVFNQTLVSARQNSQALTVLPRLRDIDEYDDLLTIIPRFPSLRLHLV